LSRVVEYPLFEYTLTSSLPCVQEVPPTEPVEEGDEGVWDPVGEPAGSRSPAPTVEELLAQLERQPPAPEESRGPVDAAVGEVAVASGVQRWPQECRRRLRRPPPPWRRQ
jgi:hypothetical protein